MVAQRKHKFVGSDNTDNHYQIRPVEPADLRQLIAIERLVFSDPWSLRGFEAIGGWSRVVELDQQVVGYLFARFIADEAEIMNVAVHPDHRRRGLGRMLVDSAIQAARAAGARKVYLEVRFSNQPAHAFYAEMGFQRVGYRRGYYDRPREDAIVLCRELVSDGQPA